MTGTHFDFDKEFCNYDSTEDQDCLAKKKTLSCFLSSLEKSELKSNTVNVFFMSQLKLLKILLKKGSYRGFSLLQKDPF